MRYEKSIRILHILLLLTVLSQLVTELFMQVPKPGEQFEFFPLFLFSVHWVIGFFVLIIGLSYLMLVLDKDDHRNRLFPWLEKDLRTALIVEAKRDIPGWLKGKLPAPDQVHLIAGTVHGLGLLLATALGMTGVIIYLGIKHDGSMPPAIRAIREIHEVLGIMLWLFIVGHLLMATLHQIKGHRVLQNMFTKSGDS
jgi:cytochrome b561